MYINIVLLPLVAYVLISLFARLLGAYGVAFLTTSTIFITFLLSLFAFYEVVVMGGVVTVDLFDWFVFEAFQVKWGFLFDALTVLMLLIVTLVSALVHLYSFEYMAEDPHLSRFMTYLTLFTFFMIALVTSSNYLQLFLGWEGVGLVSYLLVNFWHTRIQANKSALKAILVNRIGDFFFFFGIITTLYFFNSLNYELIFTLLPFYSSTTLVILGYPIHALSMIGFLFFLGAVGKSAQLGLHTWLPDAMEGPTPVSALIHAATMVTAGVFLLLRSSPLIELCPGVLNLMVVVGALTAFLGASIGMFQNDLKKVIAYSTCSQLGYMVLACGVSAYNVSLYHLVNHAFFKALLFLSAGCVIHSMSNEQDMRRMGGLRKLLPYSYVMILVGSLSIMGFPFLTGFYSKDALLEVVYADSGFYSYFGYLLAIITAMLTAFYSLRLLYLTFLSVPFGYKTCYQNVHESTSLMMISLAVLGTLSIFGGYVLKDVFIGLGSSAWLNSFGSFDLKLNLLVAEFLPVYIKLLPVVLSILVAFIFLVVYVLIFTVKRFSITRHYNYIPLFRFFYRFFVKKWYFDLVYNYYLVFPSLNLYYKVFKSVDRGLFEYIGPTGIVNYLYQFKDFVHSLQLGPIYVYLAHMALGISVFLAFAFMNYLTGIIDFSSIAIIFYCLVSTVVFKLVFKSRHDTYSRI